jgi:hypothetical protein
MGFHSLVNTEYFSEAANDFRRNGRRFYTDAPNGSRDYNDYWEMHERRCQEGYQVGDLWIPGRYYFYLNFFPMWKIADELAAKAYYQFQQIYQRRLKGSKEAYPNITADRIVDFARFTEVDYEWWNFKHIAWSGGSFMGIDSPGGRHIGALKARGAGWSYKEAADGIYNYNFIDGSKSYFFAGREDYLTKDGILNKVEMGLDFINENIPFWKQNRSKKKTLMNQKASWLDDKGNEHGTMSEILGVIVDDPNKTRGKRGRKITFEEGGSFPKLKDALEICLGSIRDGSAYVGQVSVFGTGGEEGPGIEGLDDIFNSPEAWDMMVFPNVWEEGMESESCGYFVPCWRVNNLAIDSVGNVDMEMAIDLENIEREKKKKSSDPKAIDRRKAEYPTNPSEALMRLTVNNFPIDLIDRQLKRLKTNRTIKGNLRHGKYIPAPAFEGDYKMTGVQFVVDPEANPIIKYPHTRNDDLTGCVTIKEAPFRRDEAGAKNVVPGERGEIYFITIDPVQLEDAEDLTSLWAVYVWKQPNMYSNSNINVPVAWYVGRPKELETAFKTIFAMAVDYNALIQSEIAGGGQAIYTYGKSKNLLEYIAFEMAIDTKEQDVTEMKRNRSYFMNMTANIKNEGLKKLIAWCSEIVGLDGDGEHIVNIHNVDDEGFLMEMKKFRANRNADRVSQALLAMYMLNKGTMAYEAQKAESRAIQGKGFFDRPKFGGSPASAGQFTSAY